MHLRYHSVILVLILMSVIHLHQDADAAATLKFDKPSYTPFEKATLTLTDSSQNKDSEKIESVDVPITGSSSSQKITLKETAASTGVFAEQIRLSPDLSKFPGDIEVKRDDGLTASYRIDNDNIILESVLIEYHEGTASFDKSSYTLSDEARVIVNDLDAGRNPDAPDSVEVKMWSDTDPNGVIVSLRETSSGIFEERFLFTLEGTSQGNRLRVSDGDTISVRYIDNTLPAPAQLSSDGVITSESKNIVATSVFGKQVPPTQRAPASDPTLMNAFGETLTQVTTGEQVLIQSQVVNMQNRKQPFAYIVQVKDSDGLTVSLSWITAVLAPNDSLKVSQSWLPLTAGQYTIEVFVWESTDNPIALSPVKSLNVQVLP